MKSIGLVLGLLAVAAGAYWYYQTSAAVPGRASPAPGRAQPSGPVPVTVAAVVKGTAANEVIGIATLEPFASVAVKARVDGEIAAVNVREGDEVKAGDLLFTLDQRSIDAQIAQARANLARDQAQLDSASKDLAREVELASRGAVAQAVLDRARATAAALQASVQADQAQLDFLAVQRSFTEIRAPIAGRLGSIAISKGNLVRANDTQALVIINQTRPLKAMVPIAQRHFDGVRAALASGKLPAAASNRDRPGSRVAGSGEFLDNAIDPATGTFGVRTIFANEKDELWPGMVVNVTLQLGADAGVMLVPTAALQPGQRGPFVFIVKPDDTVEVRDLAVVREVGQQSVVSGVSEDERVVTQGQLRLTGGSRVTVQSPAAAPVATERAR